VTIYLTQRHDTIAKFISVIPAVYDYCSLIGSSLIGIPAVYDYCSLTGSSLIGIPAVYDYCF